jgi:hypothetical protein
MGFTTFDREILVVNHSLYDFILLVVMISLDAISQIQLLVLLNVWILFKIIWSDHQILIQSLPFLKDNILFTAIYSDVHIDNQLS